MAMEMEWELNGGSNAGGVSEGTTSGSKVPSLKMAKWVGQCRHRWDLRQ